MKQTIKKPTLEEYEEAKNNIEFYAECIGWSRNRQTELIDALSDERDQEKSLLISYENAKRVIVAYDIYKQVEKGENDGKNKTVCLQT